jgi:hypothetical protein
MKTPEEIARKCVTQFCSPDMYDEMVKDSIAAAIRAEREELERLKQGVQQIAPLSAVDQIVRQQEEIDQLKMELEAIQLRLQAEREGGAKQVQEFIKIANEDSARLREKLERVTKERSEWWQAAKETNDKAIAERDAARHEREHWRLDATKSHVECDNLKQRIAALEHGESEYQKALQAYENQVVTLECRIAALEQALDAARLELTCAGNTFSDYAQLHYKKNTPEGNRKAAENQKKADQVNSAALAAAALLNEKPKGSP